ncbi:MAG: UDP-glucose 4-epimerase GalE [Pseudomonadota bacterium]
MTQKILLTGGAGFIGSHTFIALLEAGYVPIIFDNLCNSNSKVFERLQRITSVAPIFIHGDIRDGAALDKAFTAHEIGAVLHFAGLKAVGESVEKPLEYYDNNVRGTLELLAAMRRANVYTLVFSSSATVYGDPASTPIDENFPLSATNPYGRSKLMIEEILGDLFKAELQWNIARLRYFNPAGAHESGLIGEDPQGIPNNLMPYIAQVAVGRRQRLQVFGGDYPTPDGTGVRDFIHVMDLAEGHVAALKYFDNAKGLVTVNLGTGNGASVLQMIAAFETASGKAIPYDIAARRPGDIAECWANPGLAKKMFGWSANRTLAEMTRDGWHWQSTNPKGYLD